MNNLIRTLKIVFLENSPEDVLVSMGIKNSYIGGLDENAFSSYLSHKEPLHNIDEEARNIYQNMLEVLINKEDASLKDASSKDLLRLPLYFTKEKQILRTINHHPVCHYNQFLNWRILTYKVGEDMLTTAYLAETERYTPYERQIFDWKPLITHDNEVLQEIMSRGISENHYHLKGSAPHFDLSWISLMNSVSNRNQEIDALKKIGLKLNPQLNIHITSRPSFSIEERLVIAAAIRYYFYKKYTCKDKVTGIDELNACEILLKENIEKLLSNQKTNYDLASFTLELENRIKSIMTELVVDMRVVDNNTLYEKWQKADYFIKFPTKIDAYENWTKDKEKAIHYKGNRILSGERRFQYLVFKDLYNETLTDFEASWFYAYQLIKLQFRAEFVQVNDHVGFNNFAIYQNRKTVFIPKKSIYEEALYNLAINSVLEDQYVQNLECRIGSEFTANEYMSAVKKIDGYVSHKLFFNEPSSIENIINPSETDERYFYTIHFVKEPDKNLKKESKSRKTNKLLSKVSYQCRNYEVRETVKTQASALMRLRKSSGKSAHRILGIDAANFEIGCRPEVFAQAFRFLRSKQTSEANYLLGREVNDRIGVTYHAGEDFIDLADGLRAIVESVRFIELSQGDRIGHALALGIDPYAYYEQKKWEIPTKIQDALDNAMWVYAMMRKYGIDAPKIHDHLRKLIMDLSGMVYGVKINSLSITPELLYDAWKLRGDAPEFYLDYRNHNFENGIRPVNIKKPIIVSEWDSFSEASLETDERMIRQRLEAGYLNYLYHYDYDVKMNGYGTYLLRIDKEYASVIDKIQYEIQKEIAKKNICIETNPSSNYLIGTFKRYAKHPILRFNNYALKNYQYKDQDNLQLLVSINTDDQGVFATYLENEYALMALALEKEKDANDNPKYTKTQIYEWVDKIRQMGNQQSFRNRIK